MCEANAYLINGEKTELLMEAVDIVEPEEDGIRLESIFGDQKFVNASIHSRAPCAYGWLPCQLVYR
jgi:predicted RNA-binding protein